MTMAELDWTGAASIDGVLERMDAIDSTLPRSDGVAIYNRMYRAVTDLVGEAVAGYSFVGGDFIERLDVHFANLYFVAYENDLRGRPVPAAWAPLFELRQKPDTHAVQFALAGISAHIANDLPLALVSTFQELAVAPEDGTPEHSDFCETNRVIEDAADLIKGWFTSGLLATIDEACGRLDDGLAMFGIHTARAAAWEASELLHGLTDNPRLDRMFRAGLGRTAGLAARGILL
jgi:hypothetical protein